VRQNGPNSRKIGATTKPCLSLGPVPLASSAPAKLGRPQQSLLRPTRTGNEFNCLPPGG